MHSPVPEWNEAKQLGRFPLVLQLGLIGAVGALHFGLDHLYGEPAWGDAALAGILAALAAGSIWSCIRQRRFHEAQKALNNFLYNVPLPVFIKDTNHRYIYGNKAFYETAAILPEQTLGRTVANFTSPETAEAMHAIEKKCFETGEISEHESRVIDQEGREHIIISRKRPITIGKKKKYLIGWLSDVSDAQQLEARISHMRREMEQQARGQTQILKIAKERAETLASSMSEFLANMSHELRTPLNSIVGFTNMLLDDELRPEQREMIGIIELSSHNLLEIVNDILDLSKIEAGGVELETIAFSPYGLITRTVSSLVPFASSRGLNLSLDISIPPELLLEGDPTRLSRILNNLIGNAIKYTEVGKVVVTAGTRLLSNGHHELMIEVQDTGIGIPQDKLSSIFDKFTQADSTITRRYGGTGLGLAITKQLVEMMWGQISVRSTVSIGSCFRVILPLPASSSELVYTPASTQDQAETAVPVAQARILVAEDHKLNQVYVHRLLDKLGIATFKIVDDGRQVLDEVKTGAYDLVLMDCHMPEVSGYEATGAIRFYEKGTGKHIPIVAMTANAMVGEREKCLASGMDEYVSKPVTFHQLKYVLSRWIQFGPVNSMAPQPVAELKGGAIDRSIIQGIAGDAEMAGEFARLFIDETEKQLCELRSCVVEGRSERWKEICHMLKGSAANIGAIEMRELCGRGQKMLIVPKREREIIFSRIQMAFNAARVELEETYGIKKGAGE